MTQETINIPHQTLINIKIEAHMHELLPNGQVNGKRVGHARQSKLLRVTGKNNVECDEATQKLLVAIDEFLNTQQKEQNEVVTAYENLTKSKEIG